MANKSFVFRFDDVEVRAREFSIVKAEKVLTVEPKAFRVLLILLRNPQKLIPKEEILSAVWGETAVGDGSLTRSIWLLWRLLGDDTNMPRYIETVATVGYRLACKVEVSESASEDLQLAESADGPGERIVAGTPSDEGLAKAVANPLTQNDKLADYKERRISRRLLPGALFLAVGLAAAIWYLRKPLPQLQVAGYTPITHEGRRIFSIAGTDGSRLYFNWKYGPDPQPNAEVAISGGGIAQVSVPLPFPLIKDVHPDGSALLVASYDGDHGSLWNVELPAYREAPRSALSI